MTWDNAAAKPKGFCWGILRGFQHHRVTGSMGTLHTRWPVFGIRVTEANLRPEFGSVSASPIDCGLRNERA